MISLPPPENKSFSIAITVNGPTTLLDLLQRLDLREISAWVTDISIYRNEDST